MLYFKIPIEYEKDKNRLFDLLYLYNMCIFLLKMLLSDCIY